MAKAVRAKSARQPVASERAVFPRRAAIHFIAAILVLAASALGFHELRRHVEKHITFPPAAPRIVLKNIPPWMSPFLAQQIADVARPIGLHSAFDHQLLIDTCAVLRANPWIRQVNQVRRAYGQGPADTIEIDCDYRAPVALVHWGDYYWLVDGEGVKLPEAYTPQQVPQIAMGRDHAMIIRLIEGVRQPPAAPGHKWAGEDLAAGIDMVKLLFDRPYAQEIVKVDVSNCAGRVDQKEAQLVLITKYGSEVRWGRPINSRDYFVEVTPAQKLNYLAAIFEQTGRIDGRHPWVDIRFDAITCPSTEAAQANYQR